MVLSRAFDAFLRVVMGLGEEGMGGCCEEYRGGFMIRHLERRLWGKNEKCYGDMFRVVVVGNLDENEMLDLWEILIRNWFFFCGV